MADVNGNIEVPLGRQGSGLAQVLDNDKTVRYLQQARQRQDQINHYAQLEKLKRDELEARRKKAEEDNMVAAKWEVDNGLDFATGTKQLADADIMATKRILADPTIPKHKKDQAVADSDFLIKSRNTWAANQKTAFDAVEKNAKYYNIDPVKRIEYVKGAMTSDPQFYKRGDHAIGYEAIVKDPYNFNAKEAGVDLLKGHGTTTVKVKDASGRSKEMTWDNILNQPKLVGQNRVVAEINPAEAAKLIGSNPQVADWYNRFVERKQKDILAGNPSIPPIKATELAIQQGTDKLFEGLAKVNYSVDNETTKGRAKSSAEGTKMAEESRSVTPLSVPYTPPQAPPGVFNAMWTAPQGPKQLDFGPSETVYLPKPLNIGANQKAYLFSTPDETTKTYLTPQPDGGYTTNFGFNTRNVTYIKNARQAEGEIITPTKRYSAGEFLTPEEVQDIRKAGLGDRIKIVSGKRFSPGTFQVDEDEGTLKNPTFQKLDIFIPDGQAIETESFSGKGKAQKTKKLGSW